MVRPSSKGLLVIVTPTFPPPYNKKLFENLPQAPQFYHGLKFDIREIDDILKLGRFGSIRILEHEVLTLAPVVGVEDRSNDERDWSPLTFTLLGETMRTWVSIWRDRIEIDFRPLPQWTSTGKVEFPVTRKEFVLCLNRALRDARIPIR